MRDIDFMQMALDLSAKNIGITYPNPSVGCVIVKDNQIIATAVTAPTGRPHAETIALKQAGSTAYGADMYVTLEPCCHWGATPPCVDAIINAKIKKVVIAAIDPDVRVMNSGVKLLKDAGIEVEIGLFEEEARNINKGFFKSKIHNLPYIAVKIATSLDAKIALKDGRSKWITNPTSRSYVHKLRAKYDAVLVGVGTINYDNPSLDCRIIGLEDHSPVIFIIDKDLRIDTKSKVFLNPKKCYIITSINNQNNNDAKILEELGVNLVFLELENNYFNINDTLKAINKIGITSLLIEGGAGIFTWFIKSRMFDELIWINANILLGDDSISAIGDLNLNALNDYRLKLVESFSLGEDLVRIFKKLEK